MKELKLIQKKSRVYFLAFIALMLLSGCSGSVKTAKSSDDIISQKYQDEERTQISVLVKYAFSINSFETIIEKKFPDIDIVQVGNFTANTVLAKEYEARLKHDDLTDIVMTWPLDVGSEYWDDRLIDMSGMAFTSQYNTPSLDAIAQDGKLYYLPGPAQIRGLVYNKTLFEENGWVVPNNYEEFIALCKQIEGSGIPAMQLSLGNSEVFDTAFTGLNFSSDFSTPKDGQWIADYNEGVGKFSDHFSASLDNFQRLIDENIIKASDLDLYYQDVQRNLFTRKTAMIEDSVQITQIGKDVTGTTDEFALMPIFSPGENSDWVRMEKVCFIGMNQLLLDLGQKEKYEKVLEIMEFISTQEGQNALASDTGGMLSSLREFKIPEITALDDMKDALNHGRYSTFPKLKNIQSELRMGLAGMVDKTMQKDEVSTILDEVSGIQSVAKTVALSVATSDFTMIDTGNFVCDAMRKKANSDIALFMDNGKDGLYNGKGISARFYKGDVTQEDIDRVYPDIKHGEKGELWKVNMSGKDLIKTLEYSMEIDNRGGWFYYFSGLKMEYDPVTTPGKRIKSIELENGDKIDENKIYTVAIMDDTVEKDTIQSYQETGILIKDLIKDEIVKQKKITPAKDNRFIIYQ